jgi:hypothetical protein
MHCVSFVNQEHRTKGTHAEDKLPQTTTKSGNQQDLQN